MLTISVKDNGLQAVLGNVAKSLRKPLMRVLGKSLEVELRRHFKNREAEPNKRGWPKQHFWARRIRNVTAYSGATETTATVTISDPAMAARINGATIRPVEKQFLAIPLRKEAYGIRPSSGLIPNLFVLRTRKGAFLAQKSTERRGRRRKGVVMREKLTLLWKLVRSVRVPADPKALPHQGTLGAVLAQRASEFIARQTQ